MDIANELGYSDVGIFNALERFNIDTRKAENHFNPTNKFIELLDGTLLGDGWLCGYNKSARYGLEQNNKPYLKWMRNKFHNFDIKFGKVHDKITTASGIAKRFGRPPPEEDKEYLTYSINSLSYRELKEQHLRWYPDGDKIVPKDVHITPLSVFIWYLEDGTINYKRTEGELTFCTDGFKTDGVKILKDKVSDKVGIKISLSEQKSSNYRPRLSIYRLEDINKLISYITSIPKELKPYYGYKFPNLKEPALKLRR